MARLARPDVQLDLHTLEIIAPYALAAALVGPDSLLTVKLVDDISDTHSDKTRESLGQGAANVITGVSAAETSIRLEAGGARAPFVWRIGEEC